MASDQDSDIGRRLHSHYESLSRVIGFTKVADTKSGPILALHTVLVGALATRFELLFAMIRTPSWDGERVVVIILFTTFIFFSLTSIVLAARVYIPMNPRTGESLIYFEDVAAMPFDDFEEQSQNLTSDAIERQLLDQIHRVSKIASAKMYRVKWSFIFSAPASLIGAILLGWGSIAAASGYQSIG